MSNKTLNTALMVGAVIGGVYLLSKASKGDGKEPSFDMPSFSLPSMPQFNLPIMPQFSLPSMPQFSLPSMPSFNLPSIPGGLPSIDLPSLLPKDQEQTPGLLDQLKNLLGFGAVDKYIESGSTYREGHTTTIESGKVTIGSKAYEIEPQYPGFQMPTGQYVGQAFLKVFTDPIGYIQNTIRYGSPIVTKTQVGTTSESPAVSTRDPLPNYGISYSPEPYGYQIVPESYQRQVENHDPESAINLTPSYGKQLYTPWGTPMTEFGSHVPKISDPLVKCPVTGQCVRQSTLAA